MKIVNLRVFSCVVIKKVEVDKGGLCRLYLRNGAVITQPIWLVCLSSNQREKQT